MKKETSFNDLVDEALRDCFDTIIREGTQGLRWKLMKWMSTAIRWDEQTRKRKKIKAKE